MKNKSIKWLFFFLPFLLAFPFHFVYEYLKFPLLSIYFPVNESVFEHTKLTFTTFIISYLIYYFFYKKKLNIKQLLSSLLIAITSSTFSMLFFYYMFQSFSNKENIFLSIFSLFLAIIIGQLLATYLYKKKITWSIEISIYALITITCIMLILTLNPPYLEFFYDKSSMIYGIK